MQFNAAPFLYLTKLSIQNIYSNRMETEIEYNKFLFLV